MSYRRQAYYHETDQMGIVHHSNYIKWFEEARIEMMRDMGVSYKLMEERGIFSPVLGVGCDYKTMVNFDDVVRIHVKIDSYNGIKFTINYEVTDNEGEVLHATGTSKHCFIKGDKSIVSLKKSAGDLHELFLKAMMHS